MGESKKNLRKIYWLISIMIVIIAITLFVCLYVVKNNEDSSCIATIVGGAIGGIGTLIAIVFTTRQAYEQSELSHRQLELSKYEKIMAEYKELLFLFAQLEDNLKTQVITTKVKKNGEEYCNSLLDFLNRITIYLSIIKDKNNADVIEKVDFRVNDFLNIVHVIVPISDRKPQSSDEDIIMVIKSYQLSMKECSEILKEELNKISQRYVRI